MMNDPNNDPNNDPSANETEPDIDELIAAVLNDDHNSKDMPTDPNGTATAPTSDDDNMDFDSDDDDDSKSNHSGSNSRKSKRQKTKGDVQRSHHNVLERKRRDLIKDSFTKLKDSIPTLMGGKTSRAQILKKAADFIQQMNQKNALARQNLEALVKKNCELEGKIELADDKSSLKPLLQPKNEPQPLQTEDPQQSAP